MIGRRDRYPRLTSPRHAGPARCSAAGKTRRRKKPEAGSRPPPFGLVLPGGAERPGTREEACDPGCAPPSTAVSGGEMTPARLLPVEANARQRRFALFFAFFLPAFLA